jgi:hypothetical protein
VGIGQQGNSRYAEGIQDDRFVRGYPFLHRGGSSFAKVQRQVTNEPTSVVIMNFVDTVVEGLDLLAKFEFGKQGLLSRDCCLAGKYSLPSILLPIDFSTPGPS